jgi:hypothetical protein
MESQSRDTWNERVLIGGDRPTKSAGPTGDGGISGFDPNTGPTSDFLSRQPSNLNPLLPTYFQFSMKRCPHVTFFCQSANIPTISMSPIEQPTRFVNIPHAPGIPEFEDLVINFVVDEEMNNWLELYEWIRSTVHTDDHKEYKEAINHYTDATLTVLNSAMNPKIRVAFYNLLPVNLSGLEFDSTTTSNDAIIGSATFRYTNYEITKLS